MDVKGGRVVGLGVPMVLVGLRVPCTRFTRYEEDRENTGLCA